MGMTTISKDWIALTSPQELEGCFYIRKDSICMVSAPTTEMLEAFPRAHSQIALALLTCAVGAVETPEEVFNLLT